VRSPSPPRSARRVRDPGPGSAPGRTLQLVLHPPRGHARRGPARLAMTDRSRPLLAAPLDALSASDGAPRRSAPSSRHSEPAVPQRSRRGLEELQVGACVVFAPHPAPGRAGSVGSPFTHRRTRRRSPSAATATSPPSRSCGTRTRAPSSPRSRSQPAPRQRRRGLLRRCHPLGEAGGVRRRAPHQGPAVAFAGRLEPRPWKGREGEQRVALEVHGVEL
jgi:hypothetical protein